MRRTLVLNKIIERILQLTYGNQPLYKEPVCHYSEVTTGSDGRKLGKAAHKAKSTSE